jgi:hypothetical protein
VGQLINKNNVRPPRQGRIKVELVKCHRRCHSLRPAILNLPPRQDVQAQQKPLGFGAAVRFDNSYDNINTLPGHSLRCREHGVGLAHTRRHPEEDLQAAASGPGAVNATLFPLHAGEEFGGIGALWIHAIE